MVTSAGMVATPASATAVSVPGAPSDVTVVSEGDARVGLEWTPPTDTGGRPIRAYRVTEVSSGLVKVVDGSVSSTTFGKLVNLAPVTFTVVAVNAVGRSQPSEPSDVAYARPALTLVKTGIPEGLKPVDQALRVGVRHAAAVPMQIRVRGLADGRAKPNRDFVPFDTVVTLPAGVTSVPVPIRLRDDTLVENDETLAVELSSADARPTAIVDIDRILDDDSSTWLYLDGAAPVTEGDSGTTPMRFGLRLSRALPDALTVPIDVSLDDERQLSELGSLPVSVTFPAGTTSAALDVPVLGDLSADPSEQVSVQVAPPAGVTAPVVRRGSTVTDDDATSSGSGADVAVSVAWTTPPADPGAEVTIRNESAVAATGITLGVIHIGDLGDESTLPSSCTDQGTFRRFGQRAHDDVDLHRWTCTVGDLAAGASTTLVLAPPRTGLVVAGVTASPYDDPDHADNLTYLTSD
jgi:hypothetical protein